VNVAFEIVVEQETKGYRVVGLRNGVAVYEAPRLSGTKEKAEKRAQKLLASLLRKEAKEAGEYTIDEVKSEQLELT